MRLLRTAELSAEDRREIRRLCDAGFAGDFDDTDFEHALGGDHVLCTSPAGVVGHAAVVPRQLSVIPRASGDARSAAIDYRGAYVEAVVVDPRTQRAGIGGRLMSAVGELICERYELAALGASTAGRGLYLRHGWRMWAGRLGERTSGDTIDAADESVMVLIPPLTAAKAPQLSLTGTLLAPWRPGGLW